MNQPIQPPESESGLLYLKIKNKMHKQVRVKMILRPDVWELAMNLNSKQSRCKQHHTSFQSVIAQQLWAQLTEDKSPNGINAFQNFQLSSNCYISAHVSQIRLLACFVHGHNVKHIFSKRLACAEPGEPGNSWWRRIRSGPGEWSRLGRATSGSAEKSSAAVHTSGLTHGEKNPRHSGDKWNFTMF